MDESQVSAMKATGMLTPTEFEALFREGAELELVGIKSYTRRAAIQRAVQANNQTKVQFGEGDECWEFDKGSTPPQLTYRCNIPVVTGEISATIPMATISSTATADKELPPATYVYKEPMTK